MKVLVSGAHGFIGSTRRTFRDRGYEVESTSATLLTRGMPGISSGAARRLRRGGARRRSRGGRKVVIGSPLDHAGNLEIDAALFGWARRTLRVA